MDFKKWKDFTPKKEDSTFSKRRKSKSINKELFPGKFVCFFVSLFKRRKVSALINTAVLQYSSSSFRTFAEKSM